MNALVVGGAMHDVYIVPEKASVQRLLFQDSEFNYSLMVPDEKGSIRDILSHVGGGAINVSTALKKFGLNVSSFCKIGKDWPGKGIVRFLKNQGIDVSAIKNSDQFPTGVSYIIMSPGSGHMIFSAKLANCDLAENEIPLKKINSADFIYIAALEQNSAKIIEPIIHAARKKKVKIAINPGGGQLTKTANLLEKLIHNFDIFILNFIEAKMMAESLKSFSNCFASGQFIIKSFLENLIKMGVGRVVMTNGSQGLYVANKNFGLFHPGLKVNVQDSVGAGDAFGSIFSAGIFQGLSDEESIELAIISSTSVIQHIGATSGLLDLSELKDGRHSIPKGLFKKFELNSKKIIDFN